MANIKISSGLTVTGDLDQLLRDERGELIYYRTTGPTYLSYHGEVLHGHAAEHHPGGYGSPTGKLCTLDHCPSLYSLEALAAEGIQLKRHVQLQFCSNITVAGQLESIVHRDGKNLLFTFSNCTATGPDNEVLFKPEWGQFDMALGDVINH